VIMSDYHLGAERMKELQSSSMRPGRQGPKSAGLVPDPAYGCHALDDTWRPLCGYGGQLTVLAEEQTWRTTSMVPKCRKCETAIAHKETPPPAG
jgi:hypothetical protein